MRNFLSWLVSYSDHVIKPVDSTLKFSSWLAGAFIAGGVCFSFASALLPSSDLQQFEHPNDGSNCPGVDEIQASRDQYQASVDPVISAWLLAEDAASDLQLMPTQTEVKREKADVLKAEIARIQDAHFEFMEQLLKKCS